MKVNTRPTDKRRDPVVRLAGGSGTSAAVQDATALLRRAVMACLLWEDNFYEGGVSITENIRTLIPRVPANEVYNIAIEARTKQKLRHVPLFIAREMARLDTHKGYVGILLPQIILRADELTEFLAIYWKDGRQPLSKQVKLGLAEAFIKFNEYQLGKYNRDATIRFKDVMFLSHPKPRTDEQAELWKRLLDGKLAPAGTWEEELSAGKDKKGTWERLINERKLGALAFLRNLRNMEMVSVDREIINRGFETVNPQWLLPINYIAAAKAAPRYERQIESLMFRGFSQTQKLPGYTVLVVDVSGSMNSPISAQSQMSRMDAGAALAMLALEMCDNVAVYATAGSDSSRRHSTVLLAPRRGFGIRDVLVGSRQQIGGGGIFTSQCLRHIKELEGLNKVDRVIVFSDSQDCDVPGAPLPAPFGKHNYIIDVSAHSRGVGYKGVWTAEISGWSEAFFQYILAYEGLDVPEQEDGQAAQTS